MTASRVQNGWPWLARELELAREWWDEDGKEAFDRWRANQARDAGMTEEDIAREQRDRDQVVIP